MVIVNIEQKLGASLIDLISKSAEIAHDLKSEELKLIHILKFAQVQKSILINKEIDQFINKAISEEIRQSKNKNFPLKVFFSKELKELLLITASNLKENEKIESENLINAILNFYNLIDKNKKSDDNLNHQSFSKTKNKTYFIDLTESLKNAKINPILNRNIELNQLIRILVRQNKSNVILIGEKGVGKSSIVKSLAYKFTHDSSLSIFNKTKIIEIDLNFLYSAISSQDPSNFYTEIEKYLNAGQIIIYIKDIPIPDNATLEKTVIFQLLRNLILTTNAKFIISSTNENFQKLSLIDPSLFEKFEIIKVEEPSIDFAIEICKIQTNQLAEFHKIKIDKNVVKTAVELSKRYFSDKFLPLSAIDLLDEVCSKASIERKQQVDNEDVKIVISEKTGIPIQKISSSEQERLLKLEETLKKHIVGQDHVIEVVSNIIRRSRAGLKDPKKPIGSFLFLGSSGVGKTYLAKKLAEIVYEDSNAMIRLDMSEFSESHTVQRLIGSPPGFVGYEEGGQLTNPVLEKPYSLILLDEIEKANPSVFDIFLQVLDEGRLTDGKGKTVDFKNTIIIATSNIASKEIVTKYKKGFTLTGFERENFIKNEIYPILEHYFRIEFINRFDEIVIFNPLDKEQLSEIAKIELKNVEQKLLEKNIKIVISPQTITNLVDSSFNPDFGARPLLRAIREKIENVIAKKIISQEIKAGDIINL